MESCKKSITQVYTNILKTLINFEIFLRKISKKKQTFSKIAKL